MLVKWNINYRVQGVFAVSPIFTCSGHGRTVSLKANRNLPAVLPKQNSMAPYVAIDRIPRITWWSASARRVISNILAHWWWHQVIKDVLQVVDSEGRKQQSHNFS